MRELRLNMQAMVIGRGREGRNSKKARYPKFVRCDADAPEEIAPRLVIKLTHSFCFIYRLWEYNVEMIGSHRHFHCHFELLWHTEQGSLDCTRISKLTTSSHLIVTSTRPQEDNTPCFSQKISKLNHLLVTGWSELGSAMRIK